MSVLIVRDEDLVLLAELASRLHLPELHHDFQMRQDHLQLTE